MNDRIDKKAIWDLSYGMYIVSSGFNGKQNGQVANTVFQITAEPPRIAVSMMDYEDSRGQGIKDSSEMLKNYKENT